MYLIKKLLNYVRFAGAVNLKINPVIVLMGIDGTGKSTQTNLLFKHLMGCGIKVKNIYAGNTGIKMGAKHSFYLSQPLDILVNRLFACKSIYHNRLLFFYKILDFLNYLLLVLPKVLFYRTLGYTIITDRYVYDYILSTLVAGTYSSILSRLLVYLAPCPSLVILLYMNPNLTHLRKHEVKTLSEITLCSILYRKFQQLIKAETINAEASIEKVSSELFNLVNGSAKLTVNPQIVASAFEVLQKTQIAIRLHKSE